MKTERTKVKQETGTEKLEQAAKELRELGDSIRINGKSGGWDVATEAVAEMRKLADAIRTNAAENRALMIGSIEALLAGADILSCDCVAALQEERDTLQGGTQAQQLEAEAEERAWARIPYADCADQVERIEKILDAWTPDKQRAILSYVFRGLPEKEANWASEQARDESRDELLNYLHNHREFDEQVEIYKKVLEVVKQGNGIVEFKKVG